jgi:ABC-2 type transport system permease protein
VPGLLGMNIMSTGLFGIGFSIVQARTRRLLKRLTATPMRRSDYLLAQILARLVFLGFEVGALLLFAWLVFGVPVRGSLLALAAVTVLGALSFGGLGVLLASRARTLETISGLLNFVMLPMWLLSGVFFSSANFPQAMQPFIRALPLTALNEALRGVALDADPLMALWAPMTVLVVWGGLSFAVALGIFRWR